jgi:hypothetical protein
MTPVTTYRSYLDSTFATLNTLSPPARRGHGGQAERDAVAADGACAGELAFGVRHPGQPAGGNRKCPLPI